MSNEEKLDESSASQLNLLAKPKTTSSDKIPKITESQPVIINFYSNSSQKSDKLVQTDLPTSKQAERKVHKYPGFVAGTNFSASETTFVNPEEEDSDVLGKNSDPFLADETTETGLMEHRKHVDKHAPVYKSQTDLERKKLEAELKAAEEIAKIKQTVIEKRLAVELAALNDDSTVLNKAVSKSSPPPPELTMEDLGARKQSVMESNLAQEMDNMDFQTRYVSPRASPPASSRIANPSSTGLPTYRQLPEQRYDPRERQLPEQRYDPRERQLPEQRYDPRDRPQSRKDDRATLERHYRHELEYPFPPDPPMRTQSIWRSAFAKIKKKMKSKPSEKWDE